MRLGVAFVFNPVHFHIDRFTPANVAALGIEHGHSQGEALVITSTLQLHRLIADQVTIELLPAATYNKMTKADALLHVLCGLKPKLLVLTEQEAHHNDEALSVRVLNAFDYYVVLFHDLEPAGDDPMRAFVENRLLKEEINDIVACDGTLRRERHEKMTSWLIRMMVAGFQPAPVSANVFQETVSLTHQLLGNGSSSRMYRAQMANMGCIFLYACKITIFSVSAWQPVCNTIE
jgi:hypothetical protein